MSSGEDIRALVEPNVEVEAALRRRIAEDECITFAEFMSISLSPPDGYYATRAQIGEDFKTAPEMHPAFGYTVANAINPLLNLSSPNTILEMGAGNGTLARDVLHRFTRSKPSIESDYYIAESSPKLIVKQQELLCGLPVHWLQGSVLDVNLDSIDLALSNELLDTLPVHRLHLKQGDLKEIYITTDREGKFTEVDDAPSSIVQQELAKLKLPGYPEVDEFTISPTQRQWTRRMAQIIRPGGHLVTIDYAVMPDKPDSYIPRVYAQYLEPHTGHPIEVAYKRPGTMDVTTSVNFEHLKIAGESVGLKTVYENTQAAFLKQYGFEAERDRVMAEEAQNKGAVSTMAHYFGSYILTSPDHMGSHRILIQRKLEAADTNLDEVTQ